MDKEGNVGSMVMEARHIYDLPPIDVPMLS